MKVITELEKQISAVQAFIDNAPWREAKTYAATWSHEYVVRQVVNDQEFANAVAFVREQGNVGPFYGQTYIYWHHRGYAYWSMGFPFNETEILNR